MAVRRSMDADLERQMKNLLFILKLTNSDISFAGDIYGPYVKQFQEGRRFEKWELFSAAKPLIWALLGQLDAASFVMRRIIVEREKAEPLGLTNREIARLDEKVYDTSTDSVLDKPSRFLTTLESFKLALKYLPQVLAVDLAVDLGEPGWQSLSTMVKARNQFTHPEKIEDLAPLNALVHLQPALLWAFTTMRNVMAAVTRAFTGEPATFEETSGFRAGRVSGLPKATDILDEDFYGQVKGSSLLSLRYVSSMMARLHDDVLFATSIYSDMLSKVDKSKFLGGKPLEADEGLQFASRNMLRAFFAQVEGTISFARFMLESASSRGEISLGDTEVESFYQGDVDEQLWAVATAWSREFGHGRVLDKKSNEWRTFVKAVGWRNGVTHPQAVMDFVLLPSIQNVIVFELPLWFMSVPMKVMEIDASKY